MGIIGLALAIVFASSIGHRIIESAINEFEQGKPDGAIEETLASLSKKVNGQLPLMIDPETRLDTTICVGKQMHYKYTMVNFDKNQFSQNTFQIEMKAMLKRNQCGDEKVLELLEKGVEYFYMYFDKNGNNIATIKISKRVCGE